MVLDQPRRGIRVEVLDERAVGDVDLLPFDEGRHRDDNREVLDIAAEIVCHCHNGTVLVADDHHLRGAVKKAGIGASDIKAAKSLGRCGNEKRQQYNARGHGKTHQ